MSLGEQLYLALVLLAFASFSVTLAAVAWGTSRHTRRQGGSQPAEGNPSHVNKAA